MPAGKGYLKDYLKALVHSSYRALELTDSLAILGAILVGAFSGWWEAVIGAVRVALGEQPEPLSTHVDPNAGHLTWQALATLLGGIVTVRLLTTPYKLYVQERRMREELSSGLVPSLEIASPVLAPFKIEKPKTEYLPAQQIGAATLRIPVRNNSAKVARRCIAHVIEISVTTVNGRSTIVENETLDLTWANRRTAEIDIFPNATEWLNVVRGREDEMALQLETPHKVPFDPGQLGYAGKYEYIIDVKSETGVPVRVRLTYDWNYKIVLLRFAPDAITVLS